MPEASRVEKLPGVLIAPMIQEHLLLSHSEPGSRRMSSITAVNQTPFKLKKSEAV